MTDLLGTHSLSAYLAWYKESHSELEYAHQFQLVQNEIKYWQDYLERLPAGSDRAKVIHALIDSSIKQSEKSPDIKCRKGCSFCCLNPVRSVTRDEVELLKAVDTGIRNQGAGCPFLIDNACSVYEHRPSICRTLFVVSDPQFCQTGDDDVSLNILLKPELIASAAANLNMTEQTLQEMFAAPSDTETKIKFFEGI